MKLSVIIPCFNAESTLGDQLAALAAQEFAEPWEVIIADNGSTDGTVSVARRFHGQVPELQIIDAAGRRGAAHARNRGASVARSDWLAFCDADDVVGAGYLKAVCEALARHEFIACRYDFKKLNHRWISRLSGPQLAGVDRGLFGPFAYAGGGSLAIRKAAHEAIGGFDEENFPVLQDTDYCIRLQRRGVKLSFVPDAVVHYRWRSTARQAFQQARNWGRDFIAIQERHWPRVDPPESLRSFVNYLLEVRSLRSREGLARWVWSLGWRAGSLEGWRQLQARRRMHRPRRASSLTARLAPLGRVLGKWALRAMPLRDRRRRDLLDQRFGSIHPTSVLEFPLRIDGAEQIFIGPETRIGSGTWLYAVRNYREAAFDAELHIGENVRIGNYCHVVAAKKIVIERNVVLGDGVYVSENLHDYRDIHRSIAANPLIRCGEVHIGEGTRIGDNVCLIGDIRIGEHCIVHSNTVVTRSLPPFSIASGIPAQVVSRGDPAASDLKPPDVKDAREISKVKPRNRFPEGFAVPDRS